LAFRFDHYTALSDNSLQHSSDTADTHILLCRDRGKSTLSSFRNAASSPRLRTLTSSQIFFFCCFGGCHSSPRDNELLGQVRGPSHRRSVTHLYPPRKYAGAVHHVQLLANGTWLVNWTSSNQMHSCCSRSDTGQRLIKQLEKAHAPHPPEYRLIRDGGVIGVRTSFVRQSVVHLPQTRRSVVESPMVRQELIRPCKKLGGFGGEASSDWMFYDSSQRPIKEPLPKNLLESLPASSLESPTLDPTRERTDARVGSV